MARTHALGDTEHTKHQPQSFFFFLRKPNGAQFERSLFAPKVRLRMQALIKRSELLPIKAQTDYLTGQ